MYRKILNVEFSVKEFSAESKCTISRGKIKQYHQYN